MDEPLGRAVGNALEVAEAVELLRGGGPEDLRELTVELTAEMLLLGGVAADLAAGRAPDRGGHRRRARAREAARRLSGAGRRRRRAARSGAAAACAACAYDVPAPAAGFVAAIDAEAIGLAAVALGAGRARVDDRIDPAVGIVVHEEARRPGRARASRSARSTRESGASRRERVAARLAGAYRIGPAAPAPRPLLIERF